jgi:hypothetical protein
LSAGSRERSKPGEALFERICRRDYLKIDGIEASVGPGHVASSNEHEKSFAYLLCGAEREKKR